MDKYILGDIPEETFVNKLLKVEITNDIAETDVKNYLKVSDNKDFNFEWEISPDLDIYWNDPSGFWKFSAGIDPYVTFDLWKVHLPMRGLLCLFIPIFHPLQLRSCPRTLSE
jgi:hypothetical protein